MGNRMDRQKGSSALVVLALLLSGALAIWAWLQVGQKPVPLDERVDVPPLVMQFSPQPVPFPDVTLQSSDGGTVDAESLRGNWTLMYFGYTHCPDVCPVELSALANFAHLLREDQAVERLPNMVFVSVDPQRDELKDIGQFVDYFDPAIVGATASEPVLRELAKPLGVGWEKAEVPGMDDSAGEDAYLIHHYSSYLLLDPEARLRAVFPAPHDPAKMAGVYKKVVQARGES